MLIAFLMVTGLDGFGQTNKRVMGTLSDQNGGTIAGASIKLVSDVDSAQTSSGNGGIFSFNNIRGNSFVLTVTSLGFDTLRQRYAFEGGKPELTVALTLREANHLLAEVSVTGTAAITVKEDTLEYATKDLKLREGALVEDALKKLDGVELDKDGNVTAQGETVTRARINGKDFFGGDIKAAIQNLPAEIVERIQIVDDYGDQANLTGNRSGDPERVLNLEIAPDRNNGDFGNFRVGGGTEERYQATGSYGKFKEGMQLSVLGNLNNVNASLFDFNIRSGGARRGRGGGSFGRGFGGGGWGGSNGLTNTQSIGVNYRQDFNEKLTMYGEYSFGHTDNSTLSDVFQEEQLADEKTSYETRNADNASIGNDHRFSWNVEYKPDDRNYIKFSPNFSFRSSSANNLSFSDNLLEQQLINKETNRQINKSVAPNYGASGLYNRRLSDNGRNIFFDFSLNTASTEQDQEQVIDRLLYESIEDIDSVYQQHLMDLQNKNLNGGATMSYIEPLGQYSRLEFNYDFNFASYDNSRRANAYDVDGMIIDNPEFNNSRNYDYTFYTHRGSLTYRYRNDKWNYSLGIAAQPNQLRGGGDIDGQVIEIHRNGFNWMPVARLEYQVSRTKRFNINYSGRASEPSFTQLQPFTDYSNVSAPVTGNPNLAAEFSHEVRINYRNFNVGEGTSFFVGASGSLSEDKIVTSRTTYLDDSLGMVRATEYLNTDGFYNTRGYYNFSKPFAARKYTLSFGGMVSFNNNVSYTAFRDPAQAGITPDMVRNVAKNWVLSQRLGLRYNPAETIDITPGLRYTYNTTHNTASSGNDRNVSTWAVTLDGSVNLTPTWIFGADLAKTSNNGYNSTVDANPMIINAYIEKQFLKGRNGAIRFQAYDVLNEQTNVSRSVTENMILDSRTNRLARYFLLTLSYRFSNFAGGRMEFDGPGGPGGPVRRGGFPGGGE